MGEPETLRNSRAALRRSNPAIAAKRTSTATRGLIGGDPVESVTRSYPVPRVLSRRGRNKAGAMMGRAEAETVSRMVG